MAKRSNRIFSSLSRFGLIKDSNPPDQNLGNKNLANALDPKRLERPVEGFPGVTAISSKAVSKPQAPTLNPLELVNQVSDPNNALTGVSLPDGTQIQGSFVPPASEQPTGVQTTPGTVPQAPAPPAATAPPVRPTLNQPLQTVLPQQPATTTPFTAGETGFLDKVNQFVGNPTIRFALARFGQALSANNPKSVGFQLGQLGQELAQGQVYTEYLQELLQKRDPSKITDPKFNILSPELKAQAQKILTGIQAQENVKTQQSIQEKNVDSVIDLRAKQAAGILTAQEQKDIADARNATSLKIGEFNSRFLRVNDQHVLDLKTLDDIKVPPGTQPSQNIPASIVGQVPQFVVANFLHDAVLGWLKKNDPEGKLNLSEAQIISQAFGNINSPSFKWQAVFDNLTPEKKAEFRQQVLQFMVQQRAGITPAESFGLSGPQNAPNPAPGQGGSKSTVKLP